MKHFGDLLFTETVKAEQARRGSREAYEKMTARPAPEGLTERERAFIQARDSFYMASVAENGWPYVQHRGGPTGFLRVLSANQVGFADYRGNRQYVSTGNLKTDNRAALFLMDYPNRARLKILARVEIREAMEDEALLNALSRPDGGNVERLFLLTVEAFDWNCPQFITPRFTAAEVESAVASMRDENAALKARVAALEARLQA